MNALTPRSPRGVIEAMSEGWSIPPVDRADCMQGRYCSPRAVDFLSSSLDEFNYGARMVAASNLYSRVFDCLLRLGLCRNARRTSNEKKKQKRGNLDRATPVPQRQAGESMLQRQARRSYLGSKKVHARPTSARRKCMRAKRP